VNHMTNNYVSRSVSRISSLLKCFTQGEPELGISEISRKVGLPKSTVHRTLSALDKEGLIVRNEETGKYTIGPELYIMGVIYASVTNILTAAEPVMKVLNELTDEAVTLSVLDNRYVRIIMKMDPKYWFRYDVPIGHMRPAYASAMGRAMLSDLTDEEVDNLFPEGQLFAGAFVPGLILSGLYMAYIAIRCWLKPELGPSMPIEERQAITTRQKITALSTQMVPPIILILGVLGSIFAGIATPTEAAGAGAFIATMLAIAYRRFNMKVLKDTLYGTLYITGFLMLLTVGAGLFTSVFTYLGGSEFATAVLSAVPGGKWASFAIMMFIVFIFGMLIEWIGSIFIVVPLFIPIAAGLGFDPLWFAIAVCVMYQTGFLSPPNAHAIFYLKGVAPPEVTVGDIIRGVWPFIGLILIGLTIITIFPRLVLWLPDLIVG